MLPRRDNLVNKSAKLAQRKKSSSEDESSEEGSTSSGSTDGSSSSSGSDSEMDTTETSFSSKSATECVGSSKQQGLLKVNHRSYAVYCGDTAKNSKNFCHGSVAEPLEDIKKDPK